ncbi:MAG: protein adenylyltransferase SelO family protein [Corynebacterium camporealensis]|uniref:protein adenylyltransferase SelO family protein n=1 Tax=Corynebacterium camporealensis TaxID=161896 RepID=UPI002A912CC4|nr:protein adenylyltransferase SelO family protein [Corynebacterium camporealensis]MDY5841132.1 protein adenylyltransferase SelO family protein [Corynebacterium camporealensis]
MISHEFAKRLPQLCARAEGEAQPHPQLVQLNEELATELGLDPDWLRSDDGINFLLGRSDEPAHALAYAGFQFGQYNPQMGDGRALLLGEVEANGQLWDLQSKGTGLTPYSRWGSDGRGTLRSMLREYLFSESLHALGIPTTRSLAVISTGRIIQRQYQEEAGVVVRVAASHLRVGTLHLAAQTGDVASVVRWAIERHYPDLDPLDYQGFYRALLQRQASTVAAWQATGFIHGVMNTDNTTLSGQTIDFGPCAFMESYSPDTCFSSIDTHSRYRFGNQPDILAWNLVRAAESMLPLFDDNPNSAIEFAQDCINDYPHTFDAAYRKMLKERLGIDEKLAPAYRHAMETHAPDITHAHLALRDAAQGDRSAIDKLMPNEPFVEQFLDSNPEVPHVPRVIPRPRNVEAALLDLEEYERFLHAVTHPYDACPEYEEPGNLDDYLTYCGT